MKHTLYIWLLAALTTLGAHAQQHVTQERMARVYEEARTPYKYGLVVAPETNGEKIECPTLPRGRQLVYDLRRLQRTRGHGRPWV